MPYNAAVLNVMIASPGDVAAERRLIREVVEEWNAVHSQHRGLVLMPIGWETHSTPEMGERPQGIINKQILKDCDLLIAVFWTRLGSPTGKAASGTVEEIEEHLSLDKPAMLYFSAAPVRPDSVDNDQYAALKKFKEDFRKKGLVEDYESLSEFREKVSRQLALTMNRKFKNVSATISKISPNISHAQQEAPPTEKFPRQPVPSLSAESKELLIEASKDQNGTIMSIGTLGGHIIQANGRNMITINNNREIARWRSALDQLSSLGLIKDRGYKGEVFAITDLGYQVVDALTAS